MTNEEKIIRSHGGYKKLKSFRVAQLVYDLTIKFCDHYIDRYSRTRDQMIQAARSGVQNIAEGSEASATSKKTELKLTQVARASLEELKLGYEDFLRQRGLTQWHRRHPHRQALVDARLSTLDQVSRWIQERAWNTLPPHQRTPDKLRGLYPWFSANAILTLATVAGYLLDRQITQQSTTFKQQGGFSERLYRARRLALTDRSSDRSAPR